MADYEMCPEGTYPTPEILSVSLGVTPNTQTPYVRVRFGVDAMGKAYQVDWTGWLSDKAIDRTVESLEHLGWVDGDDISEVQNPGRLSGAAASIVVQHRQADDGKWWPEVRWVNGVGGKAMEAMPASEAAAFSAKLRGAVAMSRRRVSADRSAKGRSAPSAAPAQTPPPPSSPPVGEQDMPF